MPRAATFVAAWALGPAPLATLARKSGEQGPGNHRFGWRAAHPDTELVASTATPDPGLAA